MTASNSNLPVLICPVKWCCLISQWLGCVTGCSFFLFFLNYKQFKNPRHLQLPEMQHEKLGRTRSSITRWIKIHEAFKCWTSFFFNFVSHNYMCFWTGYIVRIQVLFFYQFWGGALANLCGQRFAGRCRLANKEVWMNCSQPLLGFFFFFFSSFSPRVATSQRGSTVL